MPAVLVVENLPPASAKPQPNAFYIEWGSAAVSEGHAGDEALMSLECVISYYTLGTVQSMVDRGRVLGQLDNELLGICQPANTEKYRLHAVAERGPGNSVFWNQPAFLEATTSGVEDKHTAYQGREVRRAMYEQAYQDGRVERRAGLTVFFFSEVTLL